MVQAIAPQSGQRRPHEVLDPSVRRLLAQYGFAEPDHSVPCRGVLSLWADAEPDFHDYGLSTATAALATERQAFHRSLLNTVRNSGVQVIENAPVRNTWDCLYAETPVLIGDQLRINPACIVDARGRSGNEAQTAEIRREYFDRLLALWTPVENCRFPDCLILEAVAEGWWYVPPAIDGRTDLVFLSDVDLLPRAARPEWLERRFTSHSCCSPSCPPHLHFAEFEALTRGSPE